MIAEERSAKEHCHPLLNMHALHMHDSPCIAAICPSKQSWHAASMIKVKTQPRQLIVYQLVIDDSVEGQAGIAIC